MRTARDRGAARLGARGERAARRGPRGRETRRRGATVAHIRDTCLAVLHARSITFNRPHAQKVAWRWTTQLTPCEHPARAFIHPPHTSQMSHSLALHRAASAACAAKERARPGERSRGETHSLSATELSATSRCACVSPPPPSLSRGSYQAAQLNAATLSSWQ